MFRFKRRLLGATIAVLALTALLPAASDAASVNTKVWVGAPMAGKWPGSLTSAASAPKHHRPVLGVSGYGYTGDWAIDFYARAGTAVKVYAAPKDARLNSQVTARVLHVGPVCGARTGESAAARLARGGYQVQIGFFDGGIRVGSVAYGHVQVGDLNRDGAINSKDVAYRGGISRWGGVIGTVGKYTRNSCWDVSRVEGHHVHMEFANVKNFSCYRPNVPQNATLKASEYMGYLGGAFTRAKSTACPVGA